jgi:hypothetical protein
MRIALDGVLRESVARIVAWTLILPGKPATEWFFTPFSLCYEKASTLVREGFP